MKRFINSLSIKRKIMFITLGTSCMVVMLVSLSLIINQLMRYRQDLQKNLTIVADMVAFSSAAPLMFSDPKSAAATLSSLSTNPTILDGHVFNAEGQIFATYLNPAVQGTSPFLEEIRRNENAQQRLALLEGAGSYGFWQQIGSSFKMIRPVMSDGRRIGFVVLHSSTAPLQGMFLEVVSFSIVILISALGLLYLIVSYLQNMITQPIASLARTMQTISGNKDYSLRVDNDSSDETGQLIDGFNEMLGQIEERDLELERQRDTLETTVEVRTEELRQMVADLEIARDAAEAASRSKSEFLANMSHEIRTPMNGVLGMTELLMGTGLSEKQLRYSRTIYHSGASLLGIINDILDFSKIEAGKIELESIYFDLSAILNGVVELTSASACQKGLALSLTIAGDVPKIVCGDPLRLRQVLLNLISNAVKFTDRGEVEVAVTCGDKNADNLEVCFSVRDSGVGIRPEALSIIFEGFSQADGSMTRKYGGTGLGLTIAKQLAEMMGGRVTVESSPGIGSCFCFSARFGCSDGADAGCLEMNEPDVVPADSIIDLSLRKQGGDILLVEDNPVNQDVGREILECLGYRVTVAANGQEALESLTRERFALVLMDCQMPVLDGYSATRILRDQEEAARSSDGIDAHQVVIALTGHARSEDRQICIDAGMDDYLPKPFSIKQMDSLLSRWLPRPFNDPAADEEEHRRMPEAIPDACPSAASINSTGSSVSADSPLNRYYIDSIRMLDPNKSKQLLQKVVTKFIDETPRVISEIQHAVSVSDMDGVFKKAHYLKSSSANLGAVKLAEHCKALESLGRNNLPITDPALITGLEAEFRVVSVALTALLQGETA